MADVERWITYQGRRIPVMLPKGRQPRGWRVDKETRERVKAAGTALKAAVKQATKRTREYVQSMLRSMKVKGLRFSTEVVYSPDGASCTISAAVALPPAKGYVAPWTWQTQYAREPYTAEGLGLELMTRIAMALGYRLEMKGRADELRPMTFVREDRLEGVPRVGPQHIRAALSRIGEPVWVLTLNGVENMEALAQRAQAVQEVYGGAWDPAIWIAD